MLLERRHYCSSTAADHSRAYSSKAAAAAVTPAQTATMVDALCSKLCSQPSTATTPAPAQRTAASHYGKVLSGQRCADVATMTSQPSEGSCQLILLVLLTLRHRSSSSSCCQSTLYCQYCHGDSSSTSSSSSSDVYTAGVVTRQCRRPQRLRQERCGSQ
jgi:hypothetical protein